MQMPMYGSPMGYNQPYGGWQAPQQLYQPQTNSFMSKTQNAPDGLNQGYGSMPWIFVSSEEDARNRIVQPNQTAWFMDNNNPYFYVKSCDVSGAVTFKKFKFSEMSGEPATDSKQLDEGKIRQIVDERLNELLNIKGDAKNESSDFSVPTGERRVNTKSAK